MRILPNLAKLVFAGFVISLTVGLLAGFGTKLGLWNFKFGLITLFPWCLYVGLAALALGIVWAVAALIRNNGEGARYGILGLIGAAMVLALPLYDIYVAKTSPPIHDITTDIANPPQFKAILPLRKDALNSSGYYGATKIKWKGQTLTVAQATRKAYPDIFMNNGFLGTTPAKLFDRALKAAKAMDWTIVAAVPKEGRIEASDTSFFFGFVDDIVIRIAPSGQGAKLDIRSESRVGTSDVGKNAARIRAFKKELARTKA